MERLRDIADWVRYYAHELFIVLAIAGLLGGIIYISHHEQTKVLPAAYEGWAKETGNPNELTFDEWNALRKAYRSKSDTIVVPAVTRF